MPFSFIPAKAGIQLFQDVLDPGFLRGDDPRDFLLMSGAKYRAPTNILIWQGRFMNRPYEAIEQKIVSFRISTPSGISERGYL